MPPTPTTQSPRIFLSALDRISPLPDPFVPWVASDADGTIWPGDVGDALFRYVAVHGLFSPEGVALLRNEARIERIPDADSASSADLAEQLFERYTRGELSVERMCDLEARAVGGRSSAEFEALLNVIAGQYARTARPDVKDFFREARQRGLRVVVVTGSLSRVVRATLDAAEIPYDLVLGGEIIEENSYVSTELSRSCPLFHGKITILEAHKAFPPAIGLGDSGWDHPFLLASAVPILVEPKPALIEAMTPRSDALLFSDPSVESTG